MGTFYKGIEYISNPKERVEYYKNQSFQSTAEGIDSVPYRSESLDWSNSSTNLISHTTSGSHYNFVKYFFNDSSSFDGYTKLNKNKLYPSGSVIYIPQQYFGEKVKPESFLLTDNSTAKEVLIQDDGDGNLYSPNSYVSKSTNPVSHSDNYVGNIHYETGVVVLADTSSWSGSHYTGSDGIQYTDLGKDFKMNFNSTTTIHQNEIILKIKAHEFNATANQTIFRTTDFGKSSLVLETISRSLDEFGPYATSIAFYRQQPSILYNKTIDRNNTIEYTGDDVIYYTPETQALMVAKFPRPVQIKKNSDLTIIIRYDT